MLISRWWEGEVVVGVMAAALLSPGLTLTGRWWGGRGDGTLECAGSDLSQSHSLSTAVTRAVSVMVVVCYALAARI